MDVKPGREARGGWRGLDITGGKEGRIEHFASWSCAADQQRAGRLRIKGGSQPGPPPCREPARQAANLVFRGGRGGRPLVKNQEVKTKRSGSQRRRRRRTPLASRGGGARARKDQTEKRTCSSVAARQFWHGSACLPVSLPASSHFGPFRAGSSKNEKGS